MDEATFENGLKAIKTELDDVDGQITQAHERAEALKPFVKEYNEHKQKEAELKKRKKSVHHTLQLLTDFYERVTGKFPDGMFPLFSKENQPVEKAEAGT